MVQEFCASDGLTREFCESAMDVTFLAYKQKRPQDEIMMLQELATMCMREYRRLVSEPEHYLADEILKTFTVWLVVPGRGWGGLGLRRVGVAVTYRITHHTARHSVHLIHPSTCHVRI